MPPLQASAGTSSLQMVVMIENPEFILTLLTLHSAQIPVNKQIPTRAKKKKGPAYKGHQAEILIPSPAITIYSESAQYVSQSLVCTHKIRGGLAVKPGRGGGGGGIKLNLRIFYSQAQSPNFSTAGSTAHAHWYTQWSSRA